MNEFCAAMGICNLRHVDAEIKKRENVVKRYIEHLKGIEGIQLNPVQKDVKPNYAYFPVVFRNGKNAYCATYGTSRFDTSVVCRFVSGRC